MELVYYMKELLVKGWNENLTRYAYSVTLQYSKCSTRAQFLTPPFTAC